MSGQEDKSGDGARSDGYDQGGGHMQYLLQAISGGRSEEYMERLERGPSSKKRRSSDNDEGAEHQHVTESKDRDIELRRAKNRESAKRSRIMLKHKWEHLKKELVMKEELLQRLNKAYQIQAAKLKMAFCEGTLVEPKLEAGKEGYPLASSTILSHHALHQAASESEVIKAENALYVKLLSPDPHVELELTEAQDDWERRKQRIVSPAQKLDTLLYVFALDCEGKITSVRHRNTHAQSTRDAGSLVGRKVWDNLHENDVPDVRRVVKQCLDRQQPINQAAPLVFAYRRRNESPPRSLVQPGLPISYTRMKATMEPIIDDSSRLLGVIFAEFFE